MHEKVKMIKMSKVSKHFIVTELHFYWKSTRQKRKQTNHVTLEVHSMIQRTNYAHLNRGSNNLVDIDVTYLPTDVGRMEDLVALAA